MASQSGVELRSDLRAVAFTQSIVHSLLTLTPKGLGRGRCSSAACGLEPVRGPGQRGDWPVAVRNALLAEEPLRLPDGQMLSGQVGGAQLLILLGRLEFCA